VPWDSRAIRTGVHSQTNRPGFTGTAAQRRSGIIWALALAALIVTLAMAAA